MKGFMYPAFLLATALAFSAGAVAQDHESSLPENANSGVDSAQDVNPTSDNPPRGKVKDSELMPNSGVDSAQDVDPAADQGSTRQLDQEDLAPNSGVDSSNKVETGRDKSTN